MDDEVIETLQSEAEKAPDTIDLFILMVDWGNGAWNTAGGVWKSAAEAARAAEFYPGNRWRIVRVLGLPVYVAPGEV